MKIWGRGVRKGGGGSGVDEEGEVWVRRKQRIG